MAKRFRDSEFYEQETIIGINGELGVETEKQRNERALSKLYFTREAQSGQDAVITARVSGVESNGAYVFAIVYYETFKILIKDTDFMDFPEFDSERFYYPNEKKMHEVFMNSCIGAEIDFCLLPKKKINGKTVDTIDEENRVAFCSRKLAMLKQYRDYWLQKKDGTRKINEGAMIAARVVRVSNVCVFYECNGVEFKVPLQDLSWHRISNAREVVHSGERHILRIKQIQYAADEKTTKPVVLASLKEVKKNPREKWFNLINLGETHCGKITAPHGDKFYVRLDCGAEVMCSVSRNIQRYPMNGDHCTIIIEAKKEDTFFIYGKIVSVDSFQYEL